MVLSMLASPHTQLTQPAVIYDSITQTIGRTPLIRLHRLARQLDWHTIPMGKVEFFNPAGSIKDRSALAMFESLLQHTKNVEKLEIIEASSGNNGVACAWLGAMLDVPVTIVIPEHMSVERQHLIRHYGANVITTPRELGTKGAIDHAAKLVAARPDAVSLNQFSNRANVYAHQMHTAPEIWHDTQGKVDAVVAGIGTGGTITGLSGALRAKNPDIEIIAVEPARCPVLSESRSGVHNIQGLSSGHIPEILDTSCFNQIITVSDEDAVDFARKLARVEGLAVGISSGAAMWATGQLAKSPDYADKHIVTILPDGAERYFSTSLFASPEEALSMI